MSAISVEAYQNHSIDQLIRNRYHLFLKILSFSPFTQVLSYYASTCVKSSKAKMRLYTCTIKTHFPSVTR